MTNDPLGLFDEEDKDPLGLFSVEDDTGFLKAAGESLLSLGTSSLAAIPAGLAGIGASVMGGAEKGAAKVAEVQALAYQPRTERGQRYTENVAEVLNKPVEWLGAGGEAIAGNEGRLVGEIAGNFALDLIPFGAMGAAMRKGKPAKETSPKLNKLDKLEEATATPQTDPLGLYEQGELDLFSPDQKQLGVSPYDAVGGKWAVDENGIPVKQELSEEVSRTQEGGQARLFDDPIFEEPATKKYIESEAAWQEKARQDQVATKVEGLKQKFQPPKGQRGAIDIKAIEDGMKALSRGDIDPPSFLQRWKGTYNPKEWDSALKALDEPSSRDTIAFLSPEQFHSLAHVRTEAEVNSPMGAIRRAGVKNALTTKAGLDDIPYLKGVIKDGVFEVEAHNGRHRMDVFQENGLELVPVRLRAWKEDGFRGWGSKDAPRMAKGQEGNTMALPQNLSKKGVGKVTQFDKLSLVPKGQRGGIDFSGDPRIKDLFYKLSRKEPLNSKEAAFIRQLEKDDLLGFGTAKQAVQALYEDPQGSHPITSGLSRANTNLSVVPKNQRGGIDTKAIGEAIKKFTSTFEKPEIKGTDTNVPTRESVLESLPGNKGILKDYIPKDPTAGEIVQGALSEKDSNLTMRGVQSGATITGMKYNSSLITGIGRLYQNAGKRAEKNIRDIVKPTEKTIMKVPKQELVELGGLMKREMFNDMTYTSAQLADAGFTPKQIDAYTQMREMFNEAWKVQNDALVSMGKKPLTKKESYLSSRWQGPWRTPVYDKNGKLVFYIAESSKKGAERALKHLADNADIDATKSKVEYRKQYGKERGELADAYRTMLAVLDPNDARVDAVRSVYEQGKMNEAFVALGQSKHFEAKAGVRGFMGDRPWMKEGTDIVEMFQQQFAYAKNAFTWAELGKATAESKKVLSNEELMETQPNNMAYAQQYAKNKLGFGEHNGVAAIESSLAEAFGSDVQTARDFLGGWKSIFILSKLGLSPGYIMANLVQPLWTASWHADLSAKGYKHNLFTTFVYAGADSFGGLLKHYTGVEVEMTPLGTNALRYAEDNGIVSRDITDENAGLGANKIKQAGDVLGKATIGSVEHVARMEAFMSFVHHLDQSGKFTDEMKLFEKAEELVNASMVDYRPGERPMVFDQAGLIGSAAANLQTFKFNYYNQMHYFYNQAKKGDVRGLMAFLGTQAVVGGAVSMPFLQELDDAWEWLKTIVPDSVHLQIKDVGIKQEIVKALPDLVSFGGMSKITGADMSSRFDSGNLADFSLDGAFPFIADALKQGSAAASFAMNPTATTGAKAAYALAPPGPVQGAVETEMDIFKSGQTPSGKTVYKNPNKLELHDADFARTPGQEMYRKFGLRELEESKYRTQRMRQIRSETQTAERLRGQSTKFIDAVVRKDKEDMNKYAQRYIAYGGDVNSLNQLIETEAIKAQVPKEILDAARASSTNAVQKAKKMKELLNGFNY